jgi:Bacterial TSP3 repeat
VTNGPGGNWGTSIDTHLYPNADAHADLTNIFGLSGGGTGFCDIQMTLVQPGRYIIDAKPGNTGYDGEDGLVAVSESGSDFHYFDYALTMTGNVRLTEIWEGQPDGTFRITVVPEPSSLATLLIAGCLVSLRKRRRSIGMMLLILFAGAVGVMTPAEATPIPIKTIPGMGYHVQRNAGFTTGGSSSAWVDMSFTFYATGEWTQVPLLEAVDPQPIQLPAGMSASVAALTPIRSYMIVPRRDGSTVVTWTEGGTSQNALVPPPALDLRKVPGTAWSAENPVLGGFAQMAIAASPAAGPYRIQCLVLPDHRTVYPTLAFLPPPVGAGLATLLANAPALRTALTTPPTAVPPPSPFGSNIPTTRGFFRLGSSFFLDSDGDSYSDSGEIAQGTNPYSAASAPTVSPTGGDRDGDGFTDAEELAQGFSPDNPLQHPAGGFLTPFVNQTDLIITEFMLQNDGAVAQTIGTEARDKDRWVEIFNPTASSINLSGYYLTERRDSSAKWQMPVYSLGARQFVVVMFDQQQVNPLAADNGFLHASFLVTDSPGELAK